MTGNDGRILISLARAPIGREFGLDLPVAGADAAWLRAPGATFVTLFNEARELRGCIGTLEAHRALGEDVKANAVVLDEVRVQSVLGPTADGDLRNFLCARELERIRDQVHVDLFQENSVGHARGKRTDRDFDQPPIFFLSMEFPQNLLHELSRFHLLHGHGLPTQTGQCQQRAHQVIHLLGVLPHTF